MSVEAWIRDGLLLKKVISLYSSNSLSTFASSDLSKVKMMVQSQWNVNLLLSLTLLGVLCMLHVERALWVIFFNGNMRSSFFN